MRLAGGGAGGAEQDSGGEPPSEGSLESLVFL